MPVFAIDGSLLLALMRGAFVAMLLSAFGTLLFARFVAPRAFSRAAPELVTRLAGRLNLLALAETTLAVLFLLGWIAFQAADMAGVTGLAATIAMIPPVLAGTTFGHLAGIQAILLAAATLALALAPARLPAATLVLAGCAIALQAGHGHAWAMYGRFTPMLLFGLVHLFSAGAWLGGLPALLLMVNQSQFQVGAAAARWFSPVGKWCVGGIAASSVFQFWHFTGSISGLVGTAYGWMEILKLVLFCGLFALAVVNRYRLAPALLEDRPQTARRKLAASIVVQTCLGLAVILAASVLSSLPPAVHRGMRM